MTEQEKEMFHNLSKSMLGRTFREYVEKMLREHSDVRTIGEDSLQARKDSVKFIEEVFLNPLKIMGGEVENNKSDYT